MGLQKLLSIIFFLFMNFSCDSYYESEKNQFKKSSKCGEDKYSSYNKLDLAKESFGKLGVVSNDNQYPRAGIDTVDVNKSNNSLDIKGSFYSLCKSSIIEKVQIKLYIDKDKNRIFHKSLYPKIKIGHNGSFTAHIDIPKSRCLLDNAKIHLKTWARDENGNTYFAHNYSSLDNIVNVKATVHWGVKYRNFDFEYRNDKNGDNVLHILPHEMHITIKDYNNPKYANFRSGKNMIVDILGGDVSYKLSDGYFSYLLVRHVDIKSLPSFIKRGNNYTFRVSFLEALDDCDIQTIAVTKYITVPQWMTYKEYKKSKFY